MYRANVGLIPLCTTGPLSMGVHRFAHLMNTRLRLVHLE